LAALNIILTGLLIVCAFVHQVSWLYYEYLLAEGLVVSIIGFAIGELVITSAGCSFLTWMLGQDGDDVLDSFESQFDGFRSA
jgi:hypothetical protein